MLDTIRRAVAAARRFARTKEPVVVANTTAAVVAALVAQWQGELHGEAAWLAVAWGALTLLIRQRVSPAPTRPA